MKKSTHQPTLSDAKNIPASSPKTFSELMSELNWGDDSKSLPEENETYLAGTIPSQQPSKGDLELLAEMMRGRQRLP